MSNNLSLVKSMLLKQQKCVSGITGISYLSTLTPIQLKVEFGGGYYTDCIFSIMIQYMNAKMSKVSDCYQRALLFENKRLKVFKR